MCTKRALQIAVTCVALSLLISAACRKTPTQNTVLGPLVEISRPNAIGNCNGFQFPVFANWPLDHAEEPFVAVNPTRPENIVAAWIQGPALGIVAAASFDGGQTWKRVPIPLTTCSGGPYLWAGDVWLSFSSKGDVYAAAVASNNKDGSNGRIVVSKSADGGLGWSAPSVISAETGFLPDHPSITVDSRNPSFVYVVWGGNSSDSGGAVFTRTTDGGNSWEAPRALVHLADPKSWIQFSQILVAPDATLVNLYQSGEALPDKPPTSMRLQLRRSSDRGQTWSTVINGITETPLYAPKGKTLVIDGKTGQLVQDPTNPSFAISSNNGNLYAVWEDGRFSNFQCNDIAFSLSADGGLTWSAPIRVNHTPTRMPVAARQAFHPSVAVARNGAISISYYDFRFSNANPGLATDRWLVLCRPSSTRAASDSACWDSEIRLTMSSFNMEAVVPVMPFGLFLGDYFGLDSAGDNFIAVFAQPDDEKVTSVFARRVGH